MKLAWGAVHGFTSSTISVPPWPDWRRAVAQGKRHVRAVARALADPALRPRGVSLELSEDLVTRRARPGPLNLEPEPPRVLMRLGLPLWPDGGCGRVLAGNAPLVREAELAQFAREGLLLDRAAFDVLSSMGRDDILGGARSRQMGGIPVLERFADDPLNGLAAGRTMSMEMAIVVRPTLQGFELPQSEEFRPLSSFQDADGHSLSAAAWAREWPGGRLAVLPFRLAETASQNAILNPLRKSQMVGMLEWATGAPLPVIVEDAPDVAVVYRESQDGGRVVLGLANYSHDGADGLTLRVPLLAGAGEVEARVLGDSVRWRSKRLRVDAGGRIPVGGPLALRAQEVAVLDLTAMSAPDH